MQFDLFNDSHRVALHNDVILALAQGDAAAAQAAWHTLRQQCPEDNGIDAFQVLIKAESQHTSVLFLDHNELHDARLALIQTITPAAQSCLGQQADAWLRSHWQKLAQRAAALSYRADKPDEHAAPLWLRTENWQACAEAASSIASWRRIPTPLSWMLQARLKTQGLLANWGLLAELAWLSPQRLQSVIAQVDDPILVALVSKFELVFEDTGDERDLAWFPAWILTERPALASALTQAQAGQHSEPEQAMRLLLMLLGLERQGRQRDIVETRQSLRELHGALYAAYMATR
jgi:hypothetical protein